MQSGCGHKFSWRDVSCLSMTSMAEQVIQTVNIDNIDDLNVSDRHYDYSVKPAVPKYCVQCVADIDVRPQGQHLRPKRRGFEGIIGTCFRCVHCSEDISLCFKCVKDIISSDDSPHVGHVFELIAPPKHPVHVLLAKLRKVSESNNRQEVLDTMLVLLERFNESGDEDELFDDLDYERENIYIYSLFLSYEGSFDLLIDVAMKNLDDVELLSAAVRIISSLSEDENCRISLHETSSSFYGMVANALERGESHCDKDVVTYCCKTVTNCIGSEEDAALFDSLGVPRHIFHVFKIGR
jgi:hypothetical protein